MNEVLKGAFERARAAFIPVCDNECAALLEELCRRIKPRRGLEIGTAVGCSSSVMALSCDCELDTVDVDGARIEEAHKLWRDLGIEGRIHAYLGDVRQLLFRITEGKKYGIVFIDGPKSAYKSIFLHAAEHLEEGGVIISDDVGYLGLVKGNGYPPHKHRTIVYNMRSYLEYISQPPYETKIMWDKGGGIAVTEVKEV